MATPKSFTWRNYPTLCKTWRQYTEENGGTFSEVSQFRSTPVDQLTDEEALQRYGAEFLATLKIARTSLKNPNARIEFDAFGCFIRFTSEYDSLLGLGPTYDFIMVPEALYQSNEQFALNIFPKLKAFRNPLSETMAKAVCQIPWLKKIIEDAQAMNTVNTIEVRSCVSAFDDCFDLRASENIQDIFKEKALAEQLLRLGKFAYFTATGNPSRPGISTDNWASFVDYRVNALSLSDLDSPRCFLEALLEVLSARRLISAIEPGCWNDA